MVEEVLTGSVGRVTRRYRGSGSDLLLIDDCVAVYSVALTDSAGNVTQTLLPGIDYVTTPYNSLPITGIELVHGWWAGYAAISMRPGFGLTVPLNVNRAVLAEVTRDLRGAQSGEDDRLGLSPFQTVVVSKALLATTVRMLGNYRFGAGFLRRPS